MLHDVRYKAVIKYHGVDEEREKMLKKVDFLDQSGPGRVLIDK